MPVGTICRFSIVLLPLLLAIAPLAAAQDVEERGQTAPGSEEAAVQAHVIAIETSFRSQLDDVVEQFEASHFSDEYLASTSREERRSVIAAVRDAAMDVRGALLDVDGDRYVLTLVSDVRNEIAFTIEADAPYRLASLDVRKTDAGDHANELGFEDLDDAISAIEDEGFAGVAYVRVPAKEPFERAFGMANEDLNIPNSLTTIFGTGSRPIDYTKAAILLLDQQGHLSLDDTIDRYFEGVPDDKRSMTILHLMSGRSGLPDFFHTEEDWDADLAWVDRDEAVRRLLSQELLFRPGADRRHSHGAFGLLAALIEVVSGQAYYSFLREHFFDPAGMNRTGEYGEDRGLPLEAFAVGGGPQKVGLPNIPPNWGPTSWLIKGSGGMYSTLGDLLKFYEHVRFGKVLDPQHARAFEGETVNVDGSDRGFDLFSAYHPDGSQVFLFLNRLGSRAEMRRIFQSLEGLAFSGG